MHREFCRDLMASSAVNLPITSASLRSVVMCIGVESTRCTYCGARAPPRFTFTTNLMFFIFLSLVKTFRRNVKHSGPSMSPPTQLHPYPFQSLAPPHPTQTQFSTDL